jgi:hypothetical protein
MTRYMIRITKIKMVLMTEQWVVFKKSKKLYNSEVDLLVDRSLIRTASVV